MLIKYVVFTITRIVTTGTGSKTTIIVTAITTVSISTTTITTSISITAPGRAGVRGARARRARTKLALERHQGDTQPRETRSKRRRIFERQFARRCKVSCSPPPPYQGDAEPNRARLEEAVRGALSIVAFGESGPSRSRRQSGPSALDDSSRPLSSVM